MMAGTAVQEQSEYLADVCDYLARVTGMLYCGCPPGRRIDTARTEQDAVLDDDGVTYFLPVFLEGALNGDVCPGSMQDAGKVQAIRLARP